MPGALELLRIGLVEPRHFQDGQTTPFVTSSKGRAACWSSRKPAGKELRLFHRLQLLRDAGPVALLISPLLALMRNQIATAERIELRRHDQFRQSGRGARSRPDGRAISILLISPGQLANERFRTQVLAGIARISCWSSTRRIAFPTGGMISARIIGCSNGSSGRCRICAAGTTATASNRVMDDLTTVLGPNLGVSRGDLNRNSLSLQTIRLPSQAERLAWLAGQLATLQGHGIIYTLTVRDANQVALWLQTRGFAVEAYAGETGDRREALEQALLDNQVKALVATTALGMGYDKPDLAFVIHYQMPGSVVAYYQQVGRAGRALDAAYGILLSGQEEDDITDWFIRSAPFPRNKRLPMSSGRWSRKPADCRFSSC